jgi:hypothetical protein
MSYSLTSIRYSTIETKEAARIGYDSNSIVMYLTCTIMML